MHLAHGGFYLRVVYTITPRPVHTVSHFIRACISVRFLFHLMDSTEMGMIGEGSWDCVSEDDDEG